VISSHKTAIVTGAGQGIGRACATCFLQSGWDTVFVGRNADKLQAAIAAALPASARALAVVCDVSQPAQVDALFSQVVNTFGRVDLLFNNAGISGPSGTIDEIPLEGWQETLAVNLNGAFMCARAAFAVMKSQQPRGGRIINNGSIAAHSPRPRTSPYAITKHAITGLTKCLSIEGREFDIACGQIDIGNAATILTSKMAQGVPQADGSLAVETTIDPEHVARAVVYMATLPLDVNVPFVTVMANKMPYIGRG